MLWQPGFKAAASGRSTIVIGSRDFGDLSLQDGGIRAGGGDFLCPLIPSLQQQQQLAFIQLLALCAEDAPHQQIDLFPQQFVFLTQLPVGLCELFMLLLQGGHFFSQAGFEGRHHQAERDALYNAFTGLLYYRCYLLFFNSGHTMAASSPGSYRCHR